MQDCPNHEQTCMHIGPTLGQHRATANAWEQAGLASEARNGAAGIRRAITEAQTDAELDLRVALATNKASTVREVVEA